MPKESLYEFARQAVPCVGFNTRRATRLVTQYYDKALAPTGLRSTQYSLLNALSMLGEASMQDMSIMMAMDRTTLTRNLSPLLKKGLVKVSVGSDRRSRPIKITPRGKSALEEALPYWQKAQSHIVDSFGADNWDQLMRGLHQISMIVEENQEQI
ncbi:MAG: winged helix-turn-helix transcriptional regulator [Anaerolineales bacterium]|nr:winged helix-turn-helix transcriptional regulator [Anaerolineales bacterium]